LQPSSEPGAEQSFKDNALQEHKDSNQHTNQKDATVTDNPSADVDLTPLQTLTAETKLLKIVQEIAALMELTVLIALLSQLQDAPPL
jgi:hypothetical protein